MDAAIAAEIHVRLEQIIESEKVAIPLAVESGSRAWGFPSPDSDYDCRFVFLRSFEASISLFPARDVIETPITPIFDVGGWELSKALKLMSKGNAVILEWLTSPIDYRADNEFKGDFLALSEKIVERKSVGNHYYHLAATQISRFLSNPESVPLKKIFYALRPLMALRWLGFHPQSIVAPMHFPELCEGSGLSTSIESAIAKLMADKAETREMGEGPIPPAIRNFLKIEFENASVWRERPSKPNREKVLLIDTFWRKWVKRLAPCG
jgi:uncharacterized protein